MINPIQSAIDASPRPFWDFLAKESPLSATRATELGIQLAAALEQYPQGLGRLAPEMLAFGQDTAFINDKHSVSPLLLAPETLGEKGVVTDVADKQLADVWSIGVIMYILLAGHSPFGGVTRRQQIRAIIQPRPTPDIRTVRPDVGDDLAGMLYHMLQRSVESRNIIPNAETVRRTFINIQTGEPIPYSIPEFPMIEAKAILKDASQRFREGKGVLSESEYQFVRRLVDTGELMIGDEYAQLWRHSQRQALVRRFLARLLFACLLGLSAPVFVGVIDALVLPSNPFLIHLAQAAAAFAFMVVMNCDSIGIITFTSHQSKSARPPWWALPASMAMMGGLVQVTVYALGITPLYATAAEAFEVGALTGLALGSLYTLSMPGERQDTILKQTRRPLVISGLVGLVYGIYYLATQLPQDGSAAIPFVVVSLVGVPLILTGLLLSFVLGVELGDRYVER